MEFLKSRIEFTYFENKWDIQKHRFLERKVRNVNVLSPTYLDLVPFPTDVRLVHRASLYARFWFFEYHELGVFDQEQITPEEEEYMAPLEPYIQALYDKFIELTETTSVEETEKFFDTTPS